MGRNKKKVTRWIKEGREINGDTHPVNYPIVKAKLDKIEANMKEYSELLEQLNGTI